MYTNRMLVFRATKKAQRHLPPLTLDSDARSTGALGAWYVNKVLCVRKPLLLIVSSTTLLPLLVPAIEGRHLLAHFPAILRQRLLRMGIDAALVEAEIATLVPAGVGTTVDRSVLGIMNDFVHQLQVHWGLGRDVGDWPASEDHIAHTPCFAGSRNCIWPDMEAPKRLAEKWRASGTTYVYPGMGTKH